MALTKFGTFTFLHASQIDALYSVYTSSQIKAFFDSQATELKTYLNSTLTAEIDTLSVIAGTDYTSAKVRNVIESTADASGGNNGDLWVKYTP